MSLVWLGLMVILYGVVGPSVTLQLASVAVWEEVRVVGVARPDGHFAAAGFLWWWRHLGVCASAAG